MEAVKNVETSSKTNTYLSFVMDNEVFATDVKYVLEILEVKPVTRVPRAPDYINGVLNLRGSVLPVVDLRKIFNLPGIEFDEETCIIVLTVDLDGEKIMLGALVDAVREVMEIANDNIEPAPSIGTSYKAKFIQGMLNQGDNFVMLLDVNKIFSSHELSAVKETVEKAVEPETAK